MWDIPRYRIRAYVRALRRARIRQLERKQAPFHLRRTVAEVRVTEGFATPVHVVHAQVVLNEFTPFGVYIYGAEPFLPGQTVSITLNDPKRFYVRGRVISSEQTNFSSSIISDQPHPYRVAVVFDFNNHYERESVRRYVQVIQREVLFSTQRSLAFSANDA